MRRRRNFSNYLLLLLLIVSIGIVVILFVNRSGLPKEQIKDAQTVSVVDGDTLKVIIDGEVESVRLIGIDAPESKDPRKPVECFAADSSNNASEILEGKMVSLRGDPTQADRDDYGRLLRYVFLEDGKNFNLWMLETGNAREYSFRGLNYEYQDEFKDAEIRARSQRQGLWGVCFEKT